VKGWALALALLPSCVVLRTAYEEPLPAEAEVVLARTDDGVDLAVLHYKPVGPPRAGPPVVLCHGISGNARHFDLDADHSLARWLAARGYDAWSMSLRHTYDSRLPAGAHPDGTQPTNLDTYGGHDLPAVFAEVKRRTGQAQVDYVGHSMGGLVLYVYLATSGTDVRRAVLLGAPARLRFGGGIESFVRARSELSPWLPDVPNGRWAPLYFPLQGVETPIDLLVMNPQNIANDTWHRFVVTGTADMASGVLGQFWLGIAHDRFESADGKVDYLAALAHTKVPMLFVAGKDDRIALASGVKAAYDVAGGEKKFILLGEENGALHDYGHVDMLVGERAPQELWPQVDDWLEAR
jgi:poly(3-hydroxyalkanoate) synthetase